MMTQPLSASHPGNPAAPEASYPLATPTLMVGTNLAMSSQTENQQSPKSGNAQQQPDKAKQHDEHNHNTPKK